MKSLLCILIMLLSGLSVEAQRTYKSDAFKVAFTSPEKMEFTDESSTGMVTWSNDHYTLYIQSVPIAQESKKFVKNLEYGAGEIAKDLDLKNPGSKGKIPDIETSYYISADYMEEGDNFPVYVGAILNPATQMALEVVLYCLNKDTAEGEKIMKSIKLLK